MRSAMGNRSGRSATAGCMPLDASASYQGLTLAHFSAQLETFRHTSLTLELKLSTVMTHPQVNFGDTWDKVNLKLSGNGQSKLKLSGNGNECEPLPRTPPRCWAAAASCATPAGSGLHSSTSPLNLSRFHQ